ncbi:MAG: hypothetical protein LUQ50_00730 [Methanospirillum sp.]|uniref:hypothetical protein n=1 Tax=Methanospirillum sp. TaxID=45200 RepID=UPI002372A960|nr:hypothetical protein [Methanospirillum sp.]MDD1727577.1 hypothetical protein [Methanospirillum sp.]
MELYSVRFARDSVTFSSYEERRSEELVSSGLMQNGQIISTKKVGEEGTRSRTLINVTGQVSLSTETRSNNTTEHSRTYAAGPMQVSEVVALGGGEYDRG